MSAGRTATVVAALAVVALAVVALRIEQTRCAARLMQTEARWIDLRSEWWSLQARAARLRTPVRIRSQLDTFESGLIAPDSPASAPYDVRLVADHLE